MIGSRTYEWNQFDQMRIDRKELSREIRLVGREGTLNLVIKDDLPDFDELARDCFFYMNQNIESPIPQDEVTPRKPKA